MINIKSILKRSFTVVYIAVLGTFATTVASAKTVSNNFQFIDDTRFDYFNNVYERSDYKNYLLTSEYVNNNYNYYTYYYLCLTNEDITITDNSNASSNCEELYRYYYRSNTDYSIEKLNDNKLTVTNSSYYVNTVDNSFTFLTSLVFYLVVGVFTILLSIFLLKLFRS